MAISLGALRGAPMRDIRSVGVSLRNHALAGVGHDLMTAMGARPKQSVQLTSFWCVPRRNGGGQYFVARVCLKKQGGVPGTERGRFARRVPHVSTDVSAGAGVFRRCVRAGRGH